MARHPAFVRRLPRGVLFVALAFVGCRDTIPPPFSSDASYDGTMVNPWPHGGNDAAVADASSFDGGTPRCSVSLANDLLDDPGAIGLGVDLAARASDFVVAFTYVNAANQPATNVYARTVSTAGALGVVNGYLSVDAPVASPALVALTTSTGTKSGDVLLAWDQGASTPSGVERDVYTLPLDSSLLALAIPSPTITTTADEERARGAALPSLASRLVFVSRASSGAPSLRTVTVDSSGAAGLVVDVAASVLVGEPAIARVGTATIAAYRTSSGAVVANAITGAGVGTTEDIAPAPSGTHVALASDDTSAAAVFDELAAGGRRTLRFAALDANGARIANARAITPDLSFATAPSIAFLGASRLVVYRGTLGGTVSLRAAFLDATGTVFSDQAIAGASASGEVRLAAVSDTTALALFEEPATSGTSSAPGYRVRAAVLVCAP